VWTVPAPDRDPAEARLELGRRYLHVFGPTTGESFARWAGIPRRAGVAAFQALGSELIAVSTPIGDRWALASDETALRDDPASIATVRMLPSGDTYYLLHDADRGLLVPQSQRAADLWTSRVWPGAVLVDGEVRGTWRRSKERVAITQWRRLASETRNALEEEAVALPVPDIDEVVVDWVA
jgi:hypothetical protein